MMNNFLCKTDCHGLNKSWGLLVLRLVAGLIFALHGYAKLTGNPSLEMFAGMVGGLGFPFPMFFAWVVALTEFFGGIALILGIFVRPASILLSIVMLVAFFMVKKADITLFGARGAGEIDLALLSIVVALALSGAGHYSLAHKLCKGKDTCCTDGKCEGCNCSMKK